MPRALDSYSQGIKVNSPLFISGQELLNLQADLIKEGTLKEQAALSPR